MTASPGQEPLSDNDVAPADDPEWVKGVVAKALLHATDEHSGLGPTPTGRAIGDWPLMKTTIPDFAAADLEAPPVPSANTGLRPPPVSTAPRPTAPPRIAPPPTEPVPTGPVSAALSSAPPATRTPSTPARVASEPVVPARVAPAAVAEALEPAGTQLETTELETTRYLSPDKAAEHVERAIVERENAAREGALPAGLQDRRSSDVSVASPSRTSDDQLMEEAEATTEGYRTSDLRTILEWLAVIVAALAVALLIKAFVLQAFWIPSVSMETTVNKGDRILVNKVSYNLHEVRRGDLVVFKKLPGAAGTTEDLIKRAIALPGETIEVRDDGRLWIWGAGETPEDAKRLEEPYLSPNNAFIPIPSSPNAQGAFGNANCVNGESATRCTLDDNSFFMMGDNRTQSADSRSFGPVPEENIVGRAFLRIWPPSAIDTL